MSRVAFEGPERDQDQSLALLRDARAFLRVYRWPIALAAVAALLAHGTALTGDSLSVDEDLYVADPHLSGVGSGRPAVAAVKFLVRDLMPLPFWTTAIALALLFLAAVAFAFLLVRAAARMHHRRAAITLFMIVVATLPTTANMLMWGEVAIAFSVGMVLAAAAVLFAWLYAVERWSPTALITSGLLAFVVATTYQAQVFVALAGAMLLNVAFLLRERAPRGRWTTNLRLTLTLIAPIVAGGAIGATVSAALIAGESGSEYYRGLFAWGSQDPSAILASLLQQVADYLSGEGFYRGWVLFATEIVAIAVLAMLVHRAIRGSGWWPLVLVTVTLLVPFAASFLTGTPLPQRAMHALPLVAGGAWFIWSLLAERVQLRNTVLATTALALTVWHSGATSHLYFVERTTYAIDRTIASQVVDRLADLGWDGRGIAIVSLGTRAQSLVEQVEHGDAFGVPMFNELDEGKRSAYFMRAVGYPFNSPTPDQRQAAVQDARSMPAWPAIGSVAYRDGVAIVKFSDPEDG